MGWATTYIAKLEAGETVSFRPTGNSMVPKIRSRQLVTVEPIRLDQVVTGDIVLCKVNGSEYLHNVLDVYTDKSGRKIQIGNNRGGVNGWTKIVYGRLLRVED